MTDDIYTVKGEYTFAQRENSQWKCYMFGNRPEINDGIVFVPLKGHEPNWFVRWMMRVCFDCTWVKEQS